MTPEQKNRWIEGTIESSLAWTLRTPTGLPVAFVRHMQHMSYEFAAMGPPGRRPPTNIGGELHNVTLECALSDCESAIESLGWVIKNFNRQPQNNSGLVPVGV